MSFLKDKEWDNMDWLNKAVEPYTFSLNLELAKLPSCYEISFAEIFEKIRTNESEIRLGDVVRNLCTKNALSKEAHRQIVDIGLDVLFKFELEPHTTLDLVNKKLLGKLTLVKKVESINDDMIKDILPTFVYKYLSLNIARVQASYINEAMDILDCKEARSSSSVRKKSHALMHHVTLIYKDNKWNIRNVDLAIKMLTWIRGYCESGDRCSLANMSKLKCMIHNGHPIYSMEEIK